MMLARVPLMAVGPGCAPHCACPLIRQQRQRLRLLLPLQLLQLQRRLALGPQPGWPFLPFLAMAMAWTLPLLRCGMAAAVVVAGGVVVGAWVGAIALPTLLVTWMPLGWALGCCQGQLHARVARQQQQQLLLQLVAVVVVVVGAVLPPPSLQLLVALSTVCCPFHRTPSAGRG